MGKLKIILIIQLVIFGCNPTNLDYPEIYNKYGEQQLFMTLSQDLKENTIETKKNYELTYFIDIKSPVKDRYTFLKYKNSRNIIKAPFNINCNQDNLEWEVSFSCLINIQNFNIYLENFKISKPDSIRSHFLGFLYNQKKYEIIRNKKSVSKVIDSIPLKNRKTDFDSEFIISNDEKLDSIFVNMKKSEFIYWFPNQGLFKFKFHYKNNSLSNVESLFLGYLGNENKPW